jgi:hypothetical protein
MAPPPGPRDASEGGPAMRARLTAAARMIRWATLAREMFALWALQRGCSLVSAGVQARAGSEARH